MSTLRRKITVRRRGWVPTAARRAAAGSLWIPVAKMLPDSDTTVQIACPHGDEPVWLGFYDSEAGVWRTVEAAQVIVSHWQPMTEGPAK